MKLKAVFLDKDGTIVPNIPYNIDNHRITLIEGVVEGLQLLQSNGYLLVVVSNQSGIARGYFTIDDLNKANDKINDMCSNLGIYLDGFYYCPHHPEGNVEGYNLECVCRKPMPGLLLQAAEENNIDLSRSWMIGDILNDVEAGKRAGCKCIMINSGSETEWIPGPNRLPEYFAKDLADAARFILTFNKADTDKRKLERKTKLIVNKSE